MRPHVLLAMVGLVILWLVLSGGCEAEKCPTCPPNPSPSPGPNPEPRPRPNPWGNIGGAVGADGRVGPGGIEPQADYPASSDGQWIKNVGSKLDGAGMCVFSSFEMMCRYHGLESFRGFRDWCAAKYPGGGYPKKLADLVHAYCQAKGVKEPGWWQYEGPLDQQTAATLTRYLDSGRMACTTLYYDSRYGGQKIYHMVNLPHFSGQNFAILDNNFDDRYQWSAMTNANRQLADGGRIWVVGLLEPGPPPPPYRR